MSKQNNTIGFPDLSQGKGFNPGKSDYLETEAKCQAKI